MSKTAAPLPQRETQSEHAPAEKETEMRTQMNPIFPSLFNSTARGLFVVLLAISLLAESYAQDSKKPNIVVILADDLGWMDVAAYAARVRGVERSDCYYETPHIDQLADQGMLFTQAYACRALLAGAGLPSDGTTGGSPSRRDCCAGYSAPCRGEGRVSSNSS